MRKKGNDKMKVLMTVIYIIVVGLTCFFAGLVIPRSFFDENKFPFKLFSWEKNGKIYDKLHIKKWKAKIPEMSKISKMIFPKKLKKNMSSTDFDRLVKESCVAEVIHYVLCLFSVGIYYIWRGKIGKILAFMYVVLGNITYVIIQRYNRPHFIDVRDKLKMREERRESVQLS